MSNAFECFAQFMQITIYPGPSTEDPNPLSISRENALQYRLSEIGATWFNKGTSGVVL